MCTVGMFFYLKQKEKKFFANFVEICQFVLFKGLFLIKTLFSITI